MKAVVFVIIFFGGYNPIFGQNINDQNSSEANCKFFQGRLADKILDSGTYIYAISKHYSFIEFISFRKGIMMVKYRLEKLSNDHSFIVTKTYSRDDDSASTYFLAIDSNMANNIQIRKRKNKDFNNNVYLNLNLKDSIVVGLFYQFILEHKLQSEYFNFNPKAYVAWLKIKN